MPRLLLPYNYFDNQPVFLYIQTTAFSLFSHCYKQRSFTMIPTVEWKNGIVRMLDQTKLPLETVYQDCKDYQTVARGIKELWVRGAPAIGVSAAMGLALGARQITANSFDEFWPRFEEVCSHMAATRPTAVNLFWAIERIKKFVQGNKDKALDELRDLLVQESQKMLD